MIRLTTNIHLPKIEKPDPPKREFPPKGNHKYCSRCRKPSYGYYNCAACREKIRGYKRWNGLK